MIRRRLTLKRIDPWSVLKFGFVVNLALLAIGLLGAAVVWFFVRQLRLIERVCGIAVDVGFTECGVNGGNLFRALLLLGLLGVVVQTGVFVFLAFLHNLIADLVGGLSFTFADDTPGSAARGEVPARTAHTAMDPPARARDEPPPALVGIGARGGSTDASGVGTSTSAARSTTRVADRAGGPARDDDRRADDRTTSMHPLPPNRPGERRDEPLFGDDH